jgi:hypothetical protein
MKAFDLLTLCAKLESVLGSEMFQFDEKLVKGEYKPVMTDYVKVFLKEHKLTGWKPYKLWGNGTDIGEQMFFNPSFPNKFFSIASYDDGCEINFCTIYEGCTRNNELYFRALKQISK